MLFFFLVGGVGGREYNLPYSIWNWIKLIQFGQLWNISINTKIFKFASFLLKMIWGKDVFWLWGAYTPVMYKLAAKTMSRFIALEAVSIFLYRAELPIIAAAFLNSRHVSSNLTMVRTIRPSGTSVSSQISANGVPCGKEEIWDGKPCTRLLLV